MPNKKWIKHDNDTRADPKVIALMMAFGWEGYGKFWGVIELLSGEANYTTTFETLVTFCQSIGYDEDRSAFFILELINLGLLVSDKNSNPLEQVLHSPALTKRLQEYDNEKEKRRLAGQKAAQKRWNNATTEGLQFDSNGNPLVTQCKGLHKEIEIEIENVNNNERPPGWRKGTTSYKIHVWLKRTEFVKLEDEYGTRMVMEKISDLANLIAEDAKTIGGKKYRSYKNHNLTIDKWCKRAEREHVDTHEIHDDF